MQYMLRELLIDFSLSRPEPAHRNLKLVGYKQHDFLDFTDVDIIRGSGTKAG